MTDYTTHRDHDLKSYPITHAEHGTARCDDNQWPEFEAAGWKKVEDKPKKTKVEPTQPPV